MKKRGEMQHRGESKTASLQKPPFGTRASESGVVLNRMVTAVWFPAFFGGCEGHTSRNLNKRKHLFVGSVPSTTDFTNKYKAMDMKPMGYVISPASLQEPQIGTCASESGVLL